MKRNETIQNYLEAIYIIGIEKNNVRAIDVVNYLHFSRPTVSIALKELEKNGYININKNVIVLTPLGKEVAEAMYARHEYIAQLLMKLGVSKEIAYEDSCMIEHDLSDESFEAIIKYVENKKVS